jgi:hypothetical protein
VRNHPRAPADTTGMRIARWTHQPYPEFFDRDRFERRVTPDLVASIELAHCGGYSPTHGVWRVRLGKVRLVALVEAGQA